MMTVFMADIKRTAGDNIAAGHFDRVGLSEIQTLRAFRRPRKEVSIMVGRTYFTLLHSKYVTSMSTL